METAIIVRGRLSDSRHIELDEPVTELGNGDLEVVLRIAPGTQQKVQEDVFDLIARLPAGSSTKEDIDNDVKEERMAWGDR